MVSSQPNGLNQEHEKLQFSQRNLLIDLFDDNLQNLRHEKQQISLSVQGQLIKQIMGFISNTFFFQLGIFFFSLSFF